MPDSKAPIPFNEAQRLKELLSYDILDSTPEEDFNRITRLASKLFAAPMALISLLDEHRQWFKSTIGVEAEETPRDLAFCAHAILTDTVMTVPDAKEDPRFRNNALVTGGPNIRFYAGAPLKGSGGFNLGTLCILDTQPRAPLSPEEEQILVDLAALVMTQLELRRIRSVGNKESAADGETARMLKAAKQAADRANTAKSSFLAIMGHELRTPLNAILGFSELLRTEFLGPIGRPEYKEYADAVYGSGRHLLSVVAAMLEYAALESGTLVLHEETFDIAAAVREAAGMLAPLATQAGIALDVATPADGSLLFADRMQIIQMLCNVIGNAVKFSAAQSTVHVVCEAPEHSGIRLSVSDNGIGIDPDAIHDILSPFAQADARLSRSFEGCGIGLPLTRALIELHGGSLAIQSQLGTGTRIDLRLPRWRSEQVGALPGRIGSAPLASAV